jgi:hypothetical protein
MAEIRPWNAKFQFYVGLRYYILLKSILRLNATDGLIDKLGFKLVKNRVIWKVS